jgi:hypothetical protein
MFLAFLFVFLASVTAQSAPNPMWAMPFYKSPDAPFLSGQAHLKKLVSLQKNTSDVKFYRVKKDQRQFWIEAKEVVRDLHVSGAVTDLKTQNEVRVVSANEFQLQVTDGPRIYNLAFDQAVPVYTDLGLGKLIRESQLRAKPSWKADSLGSFNGGTSFKLIDFQGDWIQVSSLSAPAQTGFFPTGSMITKFDFASFVYVKDGWIPARFRQGSKMAMKDGTEIPIDQVSALITQADLAISVSQNENLKYREHMKLVETSFETWIESELPGHGRVFWKKQSQTKKHSFEAEVTTEDILEKSVYALSFHPKHPNVGIVAAQGIYLTTNGLTWKKLESFGSQNWPVLITPEGRLYVGDQMSSDWGKSFHHYFKWASLMTELSSMGIDSHKGLKMASLKVDQKGFLNMSIQAGSKIMHLARKPVRGFVDRWEPK